MNGNRVHSIFFIKLVSTFDETEVIPDTKQPDALAEEHQELEVLYDKYQELNAPFFMRHLVPHLIEGRRGGIRRYFRFGLEFVLSRYMPAPEREDDIQQCLKLLARCVESEIITMLIESSPVCTKQIHTSRDFHMLITAKRDYMISEFDARPDALIIPPKLAPWLLCTSDPIYDGDVLGVFCGMQVVVLSEMTHVVLLKHGIASDGHEFATLGRNRETKVAVKYTCDSEIICCKIQGILGILRPENICVLDIIHPEIETK